MSEPDSPMPEDPTDTLTEAMIHLHYMYKSMTDAGFDDKTAARILGVMMAEQSRGGDAA